MKYESKILDGKMMLISRDIQVGDKFDQFPGINGVCYTCKGNANGVLLDDEGKYRLIETCFKVIGEISNQATWVKEGDKFDEVEFQLTEHPPFEGWETVTENEFLRDINSWQKRIRVKGPCGHYH